MVDIYSAIVGEPPTEREKLDALAKKLRGRSMIGQLGMLTGDKVLAPMGQGIGAQAEAQAEKIGSFQARRRELEAQEAMRAASALERAKEAEINRQHDLSMLSQRQAFDASQSALGRALDKELALLKEKDDAKDEYDAKAVERLSKQLESTGIPALEQSFANFEKTVAPYIEKGVDIPGMGRATNVLPAAALSDEGKTVRQSLASIRNQVLRARSGAAVTAPEQARVYEEIGTLLGGSDEQVMQGLAMLKETMNAQKTNALSGYGDAEIAEYERRRGGRKAPAAPAAVATPSTDPADYASYEEYVQAQGGG